MTLLDTRLEGQLAEFKRDGVYKRLNHLDGPQGARAKMEGRGEVIILSSNNYLGLCNLPEVVRAGKDGLDRFGAGTASVRFICGTFTIHRELEQVLARLVGTPASLSFVSCWSANEAVPGTLLGEEDLVLSDQHNHASIIDGIRLSKAIAKCQTGVYRHADMADLDARLGAAKDRRIKMVITDGVFSMEGATCSRSAGSTTRCWWWMTPMQPGCLAPRDGAPPSTSACWGRSTSSRPPWARRWAGRRADSWRVPRRCATT
jgi:glycine C-acetyltransferase